MKGISIIIPTFNVGRYVLETVNSILRQPIKNKYEIIIVDDGSDDKITKASIKEIEHENVKVLYHYENKGVQFARNTGIKNAKYQYLMTIDADDCLNGNSDVLSLGTYMDRGIEVLENNLNIAFVHCITRMFGEFDGYTSSAFPLKEELVVRKYHTSNCIIYRKEDIQVDNPYSTNILKWQDWSFAIKLLNRRKKQGLENQIEFFDKPYYLYRIHETTDRISLTKIDEYEMVRLTVQENMDIFKCFYSDNSIDEISRQVLNNKPSDLLNLLHIASNNFERAKDMASKRNYILTSQVDKNKIP